jgi:hypothetical protein
MRVQSVNSLLQPATREAIGAAVMAGDTVTVPSATLNEIPQLHSYLTSPEGLDLVSSVGHTVILHTSTREQLDYERIAVGGGLGAAGGTGVGMILSETLKQTAGIAGAPIHVTIACALIGSALGAFLTSGMVSEVSWNPTSGLLSAKLRK